MAGAWRVPRHVHAVRVKPFADRGPRPAMRVPRPAPRAYDRRRRSAARTRRILRPQSCRGSKGRGRACENAQVADGVDPARRTCSRPLPASYPTTGRPAPVAATASAASENILFDGDSERTSEMPVHAFDLLAWRPARTLTARFHPQEGNVRQVQQRVRDHSALGWRCGFLPGILPCTEASAIGDDLPAARSGARSGRTPDPGRLEHHAKGVLPKLKLVKAVLETDRAIEPLRQVGKARASALPGDSTVGCE
jgi:hypothetical protein